MCRSTIALDEVVLAEGGDCMAYANVEVGVNRDDPAVPIAESGSEGAEGSLGTFGMAGVLAA